MKKIVGTVIGGEFLTMSNTFFYLTIHSMY